MDGKDGIGASAKNGSIFVASSGMCDAGMITKYLDCLGSDHKNAIIITGYQSENSRGYKILNNQDPDIKAKVYDMSKYYSAHADENGLLEYIFSLDGYDQKNSQGTTVFINHGNNESKNAFSASVRCRADKNTDGDRKIKNLVVLSNESNYFNLNSGEMIKVSNGNISECIESLGFLHDKVDKLTELVEYLLKNKQEL
jgi:metallo-beta-lactamase family protein